MLKDKKWQILSIILAVGLGVSVCFNVYQSFNALRNNPNSDTNQPVTVEASNYPLSLSMTIDKTVFELGEPVKITFRLENIGNETLNLYFSDGNDAYDFIVYNESNTIVYRKYYDTLYPQVHTPSKMEPGEARGRTWAWWQVDGLVYQGLDKDPPAYYEKVPPGTYHITGLFISHTLNITVETPPITITILE